MSANVCVLLRAWCWHRNCLQETAVPGGAPLADSLRSLPVCCEAGRHAHKHTHTLACTHTRVGLERGRALAWRTVQRNERVREGGMEGGRREFSREQHFPTVWGFDTWLSHIPQPCGRPSIGTQRKEGETEREEGSTLGACKQYRVMEDRECVSVFACALRMCVLTCVCLMHQCLTLSQPHLACQAQSVSDT